MPIRMGGAIVVAIGASRKEKTNKETKDARERRQRVTVPHRSNDFTETVARFVDDSSPRFPSLCRSAPVFRVSLPLASVVNGADISNDLSRIAVGTTIDSICATLPCCCCCCCCCGMFFLFFSFFFYTFFPFFPFFRFPRWSFVIVIVSARRHRFWSKRVREGV